MEKRTAPPSSIARNEQASIDENEGYPLPVTGYESYIGQPIEALHSQAWGTDSRR